jgi:hypothetical protein
MAVPHSHAAAAGAPAHPPLATVAPARGQHASRCGAAQQRSSTPHSTCQHSYGGAASAAPLTSCCSAALSEHGQRSEARVARARHPPARRQRGAQSRQRARLRVQGGGGAWQARAQVFLMRLKPADTCRQASTHLRACMRHLKDTNGSPRAQQLVSRDSLTVTRSPGKSSGTPGG